MPPRIRTIDVAAGFGRDPSMAHRVDDLLLPVVKVWAPNAPTKTDRSHCRPSAVRASCRMTRSSSTSATQDRLALQARPRSRRWTCSPQDRSRSRRGAGTRAAQISKTSTPARGASTAGRPGAHRPGRRPADDGHVTGYLMAASVESPEIYKVAEPQSGPPRVGDLLIGWLLLAQPTWPRQPVRRRLKGHEAFLSRQIATACTFVGQHAPRLSGLRASSRTSTTTSCAYPESAF